MKAMKATGDAAFTDFRCALAEWSNKTFSFGLSESTVWFLGMQRQTPPVLHSPFTHHGSRNLLVVGVALGLQAMKKADAEEAPAMKSMKATKGGQESRDDRDFEVCSKRMQVVQLLTMQVTKAISLGSCPHPATAG